MTLIQNATLAEAQARENFSRNLIALSHLQPDLHPWVAEQNVSVEWVFGRDRSLTALTRIGRWWADCSLPTQTAEAMFAKLELRGSVGCFLAPSHATQLRVVLKRIRPEQAIVAVIPEMCDLAVILHCDDFTDAMASHRLWLEAGPAWEIGLRKLFDDHIGLATPSQFVRATDCDPGQIEQMIAAAQRVFSEVTATRNAASQTLHRSHPTATRTRPALCVVAPSRFRLWNDLGQQMLGALKDQIDFDVVHFDADDPACSSPLALLKTVGECNAVLTSNTGRTDLPGLLPATIPWITWATTARIPSSTLAEDIDHLIVVEPELREAAIQGGWAAARVHVGTFPLVAAKLDPRTRDARTISILADTVGLDTPKDLREYSSHGLLWEAIRHELVKDPFTLTDVNSFLTDRMRGLGVGDEAVATNRFIEKLILPAYQQGLARILIRAGLPLRLYGQGWDALAEFKPHATGAITSREQFHRIIGESAALVHVWPTTMPHPIDALSMPVVRRTSHRVEKFVRDAQAAVRGKLAPRITNQAAISGQLVCSILQSVLVWSSL